jgi:hypothetical protein
LIVRCLGESLRFRNALVVEGQLAPTTAASVNREDAAQLFNRLLALRIRFYGEFISGNRSQPVFAGGWLNRVTSFLDG